MAIKITRRKLNVDGSFGVVPSSKINAMRRAGYKYLYLYDTFINGEDGLRIQFEKNKIPESYYNDYIGKYNAYSQATEIKL